VVKIIAIVGSGTYDAYDNLDKVILDGNIYGNSVECGALSLFFNVFSKLYSTMQ
jgi:hypothetical protein